MPSSRFVLRAGAVAAIVVAPFLTHVCLADFPGVGTRAPGSIQRAVSIADSCPPTEIRFFTLPANLGHSVIRDSSFAYARTRMNMAADSIKLYGYGEVVLRDDFVVEGGTPGDSVSLRWRAEGRMFGDLTRGERAGSTTSFIQLSQPGLAEITYQMEQYNTFWPFFLSIPIRARIGEPFRLEARAWIFISGSLLLTHGLLETGLQFTDYPAGLSIRSCYGFRQDIEVPVATEVTFLDATVSEGRVRLRWRATIDPVTVSVERRDANGWGILGSISPDGIGEYEFVDSSVVPGETYAYRLAWSESGVRRASAETPVALPGLPHFILHGLRPNPAVGPGVLAFSLGRPGSVRIEVLDVAGRVRVARRWAALDAGAHEVTLWNRGEFGPGVYLIRMFQGGAVATARAIVVE